MGKKILGIVLYVLAGFSAFIVLCGIISKIYSIILFFIVLAAVEIYFGYMLHKNQNTNKKIVISLVAALIVSFIISALSSKPFGAVAASAAKTAEATVEPTNTPYAIAKGQGKFTPSPTTVATSTPTPTPTATAVPTEYKNALKKATIYANTQYMSKAGLYNQLTSSYGEGFTADAAQYAIDNVKADWNANALKKAKLYQTQQSMSVAAIYDQLVSEYGEQFTAEEAQYAIDNLPQ